MNWRDKALGLQQQARDLAETPPLTLPDDGWHRFKLGSHVDSARIRDDGIEVRFRGNAFTTTYFYPGKAEHFEKLCAAEHPGAYLREHVR